MKINEMYLIFDKNNELVENYITTFGQAQCNSYGCISLKNEINCLRNLIAIRKETEKEIDILLNKWEQAESKVNQTLNNIITLAPYKKSFYSKKYKELSKKESNLYTSYHNTVHAILTNEEVSEIQKQINYNFMSDLFIDEMIKILKIKYAN